MIALLIGYMWLFIHRPFEVWPWLGAFRIERVYMLVTLFYWAFLAEKTWNRNRLNTAVFMFGSALVISNLLSSYTEPFDLTIQNWLKVAIFYFLLITTVKDEKDLKTIVVAFIAIFGIYMAHSFREYLNGRRMYRMGISRMVGVDESFSHPNSFAASIVYSIPLVIPCWTLCRENWHRIALIGFVCLAVLCVILTGSRSGFVGMAAFFGILAWRTKYRVRAIAGLMLAAAIVWSQTSSDLQNRFMTIIDSSVGPENAKESADSRWEFFVIATKLFNENPLSGVGPQGFPKASGTGMSVHSVYGQLVGEVGILGIGAFCILMVAYFLNGRQSRAIANDEVMPPSPFLVAVSRSTIISVVLLLIMGIAGHNLLRFNWIWFAGFQAIAITLLCRYQSDAFAYDYEDELPADEQEFFEESEAFDHEIEREE